jgi:hypothetical protein
MARREPLRARGTLDALKVNTRYLSECNGTHAM